MTVISSDVWTRLGTDPAQGDALLARSAAPAISERLIAAIDTDQQRHLLILLKDEEADLQDTQSRGVRVSTRRLSVPGQNSGRYLDLACQDASGHDAFDLIGGELANRLASAAEPAPQAVTRVLAKWRRFWGHLPTQLLTLEEQLGLFAELWFLTVWLSPHIGPAESLDRWRSPFGSRHDFEWRTKSVEVKATTSVHGRVHWIHGLEQLVEPEHGALFFYSLRVRQEAGSGNTLPGIITTNRAQLESDPEALSRFESLLFQSGYSPAHEEDYAKVRLRIVDEALFRVEQDFPRITPSSFASGWPNGVEEVRYQVNLSSVGHLIVATAAQDAAAHLVLR